MNVSAIRTSIFREGQGLEQFILKYVKKPPEGSVLVVTSKIVALSEKRVMPLGSEEEFGKLVRKESEWAMPSKYVWLTIKDGAVVANAGVDKSNADGKIVLLPRNSFSAATALRKKLKKRWKLKKLGILITDSRITPLRAGVTAVALGYAGFKGLRDYRGEKDIFGRKLRMTQVNVADSLATAAAFAMGEGNEQQPLAIVTGAPVEFAERVNTKESRIALEDDLYYPFFKKVRFRHS